MGGQITGASQASQTPTSSVLALGHGKEHPTDESAGGIFAMQFLQQRFQILAFLQCLDTD